MYKKIRYILFISTFLIFTFLVTKYYFSEKNIILINKSRSSFKTTLEESINSLPLLKSDTNNIIFYINGLENFNKKRKKRFWEKLISNKNE